jgi:hypothetical protein
MLVAGGFTLIPPVVKRTPIDAARSENTRLQAAHPLSESQQSAFDAAMSTAEKEYAFIYSQQENRNSALGITLFIISAIVSISKPKK